MSRGCDPALRQMHGVVAFAPGDGPSVLSVGTSGRNLGSEPRVAKLSIPACGVGTPRRNPAA